MDEAPSTVAVSLPDPEWEVTQLVLHEGIPFDQWAAIGSSLDVMERGVQWWIGDWLNYGERTYGEKYTQAVQETGRRYQTLMNLASVAGRVPPAVRRPGLSWSAHAEVAALPAAEQERILAEADAEGWSRDEVRTAVRSLKNHLQLPKAPGAAPNPPESTNGAQAPTVEASAPSADEGEDEHSVDPVAEWERAEREVTRLTALVEKMAEEGKGTAVFESDVRARALEGRLAQAMHEKKEAVDLAKRQGKILKEIRKLLSVETDKEIVDSIRKLLA